MNIHSLDLTIIALYFIAVTLLGIWLGGKQLSSRDYFLGGRSLPWWAVCLSVVATETSTLTFISVPGLAYISNLNFLQVGLGYIIGRFVVSFVFLSAYFRGELSTSYELLQHRFGPHVRTLSSIIFLFTRLLADGVRLFATAIPLSIITGWSLAFCIIVMAILTIIYTSLGGLRSVVWIDVIQTFIYIGGAVTAGFYILRHTPGGWATIFAMAQPDNKLQIFNVSAGLPIAEFMQINYTFLASLVGGAFLSMASHGTDQIIVQRLLACRNVHDSQKALITSGFIILLQFALFLGLGVMLYAFYNGATMRPDEALPRFIIEELPTGLSGFIIAAVFAAAMSTLSGSLNSLASSTMFDLLLPKLKLAREKELRLSRLFTILWGAVFIGGAMLFRNINNPVVELGLAISSFTYGSVLGAFFLATRRGNIPQNVILLAMWTTILSMAWFIGPESRVLIILLAVIALGGLWVFVKLENWRARLLQVMLAAAATVLFLAVPSPKVAWPWYVPIGTCIMLGLGSVLGAVLKK